MSQGEFRVIDLLADLCTRKDVFFHYVRLARDLMTPNVKTLTLDHTVHDALQFMKVNSCRHVPVIDAPSRKGADEPAYLVGVVSDRDLLRQVSPRWGTASERKEDGRALKVPLTALVSRRPKCVAPDAPIARVIATMCEAHMDMVPVLDDGRLAGVITAGDVVGVFVLLGRIGQLCHEQGAGARLVDLFAAGSGSRRPLVSVVARTVADIMTKEVVTLTPTDLLRDAIDVMQQGRFRHVPVLEPNGRVVGVVSDRDVLRHLPPLGAQPQRGAEGFRQRLFHVDLEDPVLRTPIRDIMKRDVACIAADCSLYEAARKLTDDGISSLPVVDEKRRMVGLATVTDFMRAMLATYKLAETLDAD